jgi:hypothetical protein
MSSASETDLVELDWGGGCWSRVTFIVGTSTAADSKQLSLASRLTHARLRILT